MIVESGDKASLTKGLSMNVLIKAKKVVSVVLQVLLVQCVDRRFAARTVVD